MSTFHQRARSWSPPSVFLLVGLFCLFSMGCRDSIPEPTPTEPTPTEPMGTSLLLQVVDASGHPIAGAAVSSQNALFSVDSSGHRLFENLPPGRFFARVDALGFASATSVMQLQEGAHVGAVVRLLPLSGPIAFEASQGGVIQTEQVRVTLPPDAVVDALGEPVTGTVHVTIAPLDPTHQLAAMPGPLEGIGAADGERVRLESFFMAEVSLWSNGAPVQLAPGKKATLEFLLPEALASQFESGDTVPAWWFDLDAGHWREEGAGTLQPSSAWPGKLAWVVQVNHFTWWNCDMPWTEKSCVNVHVVDEEGTSVKGATVNAQGVSYTGTSEPTLTNGNGRTCIEIKRGGHGQNLRRTARRVRLECGDRDGDVGAGCLWHGSLPPGPAHPARRQLHAGRLHPLRLLRSSGNRGTGAVPGGPPAMRCHGDAMECLHGRGPAGGRDV